MFPDICVYTEEYIPCQQGAWEQPRYMYAMMMNPFPARHMGTAPIHVYNDVCVFVFSTDKLTTSMALAYIVCKGGGASGVSTQRVCSQSFGH